MGTDTDFSRQEQLATERLRFHTDVTAPVFRETYQALLYKHGYTKDDLYYQQYIPQIKSAQQEADQFCKVHPNYLSLYHLNDLRQRYSQYYR